MILLGYKIEERPLRSKLLELRVVALHMYRLKFVVKGLELVFRMMFV